MRNELLEIKRALISVSDKSKILPLAQALSSLKIEIISTGGTLKVLKDAGLQVTPIEKITGSPEAFGGRMKTISFQVGSALLYRRFHPTDISEANKLGIAPIDLVICNLYPFVETAKRNADEDELIENIDIGGPTMIRAAAKNYESVTVLTSPDQYEDLTKHISQNKLLIPFEVRRKFAVEAFLHTANYESFIAKELTKRFLPERPAFPIHLAEGQKLRYGENPHQEATYFSFPNKGELGVGNAPMLRGKELSYNNLIDADAAYKCLSDILCVMKNHSTHHQAVVIVKHANPCGVAAAVEAVEALKSAWDCDPVSAFGGILAFSSTFNEACASFLEDRFVEVILAPNFTQGALKILERKKNIRLIEIKPNLEQAPELIIKSIKGGVLVQDEDLEVDQDFISVTNEKFPENKKLLAQFGLMANKHLKSNAISLVGINNLGHFILFGAGMGQPNRIDSLKRLCIPRAKERGLDVKEAVLISDAFFPFADSIDACHSEGIDLIVQPGGSIRDDEVISAANKYKMKMAFTKRRHFRH